MKFYARFSNITVWIKYWKQTLCSSSLYQSVTTVPACDIMVGCCCRLLQPKLQARWPSRCVRRATTTQVAAVFTPTQFRWSSVRELVVLVTSTSISWRTFNSATWLTAPSMAATHPLVPVYALQRIISIVQYYAFAYVTSEASIWNLENCAPAG